MGPSPAPRRTRRRSPARRSRTSGNPSERQVCTGAQRHSAGCPASSARGTTSASSAPLPTILRRRGPSHLGHRRPTRRVAARVARDTGRLDHLAAWLPSSTTSRDGDAAPCRFEQAVFADPELFRANYSLTVNVVRSLERAKQFARPGRLRPRRCCFASSRRRFSSGMAGIFPTARCHAPARKQVNCCSPARSGGCPEPSSSIAARSQVRLSTCVGAGSTAQQHPNLPGRTGF